MLALLATVANADNFNIITFSPVLTFQLHDEIPWWHQFSTGHIVTDGNFWQNRGFPCNGIV